MNNNFCNPIRDYLEIAFQRSDADCSGLRLTPFKPSTARILAADNRGILDLPCFTSLRDALKKALRSGTRLRGAFPEIDCYSYFRLALIDNCIKLTD